MTGKKIQSELQENLFVELRNNGFLLAPISELSSAHGNKPYASIPAVSSRGQDASPDDICPPADGAAGMDTFLL